MASEYERYCVYCHKPLPVGSCKTRLYCNRSCKDKKATRDAANIDTSSDHFEYLQNRINRNRVLAEAAVAALARKDYAGVQTILLALTK